MRHLPRDNGEKKAATVRPLLSRHMLAGLAPAQQDMPDLPCCGVCH
eukprot:COSAG06_NODE_42036_length_385_cov_0.905594_1_plen_45_part_10